jgi:hypothetical protein
MSLQRIALAFACFLVPTTAFADTFADTIDIGVPWDSAQWETEEHRAAWSGPPPNGYWSVGEPRWFLAARPEIGTPYAKPYLSVGYGMPHWLWLGVDVNAILTLEMAQAYAGVRASAPVLDLALGIRDTWSFDKGSMLPAQRFTREDVFDENLQRSRYWALEAEGVGIVPLPYAGLIANVIVVRTLDVPEDRYIYDESYRAIVAKPLFVTLRLAAVARFFNEYSVRVGALTEHVFETGRSEPVWRVGPIASVQITDHLEAMAGFTIAVASPDDLGLSLGAYGTGGLRWRWATEEEKPEAPWQGRFIPW